MAKKRITLPDNFKSLLESNDIEALKKVFTACDVNAKWGRYGSNAFALCPLSREFAFWLKEQGADVNKQDHYGSTPIFDHARAENGDVKLLIELGADVNVTARGSTPLHLAAAYCRIDAMKALIENGAVVDAHVKTAMGDSTTPLERTLIEARRPFSQLLSVCELLIENGAKTTSGVQKAVEKLGERFEFTKSGISNAQFAAEQTAALNKLYKLFEVAPAKEIEIHDGLSPIIVHEQDKASQYNKLWQYLVPPSGVAKTAQGEVIRIAGRAAHEIMGNGGMNWDSDYKLMLNALLQYLSIGNSLSETDLAEAQRLVKSMYNGTGSNEPEQLIDLSVKWVLQNPTVIDVLPHTYKR